MTMSINTGLASGIDTGSLVSQLLAVEAAPQNALKSKLTATTIAAGAYRTVNTALQAITTAAAKLTPTALAGARTATSSSTAVVATATAAATPGSSVSFTVESLAGTHSQISGRRWASPTTDVRTGSPDWPMKLYAPDGTPMGEIDVPDGTDLNTAAKLITDAGKGVTATVVRLAADEYALQLTSTTPGGAGAFYVNDGTGYATTTQGRDASIKLGDGVFARSTTNTFTDLLPGVSVTVSKADPTAAATTVSVGEDPDGLTATVSALVDAVNSALDTIRNQTNNLPGSTAALRGEYAVSQIAGQILGAISEAVGADSPARIGFELTRDGKLAFSKATFTAALKDDPEMAKGILAGTPETTDANGNTVAAVPGIAERLHGVAKVASDATTGTLTSLASGQDSQARDLKDRIAAWDVRLARRRVALNRQFTAMETALSSLQNQSNWLGGQLSSLS